MRKGEWLLTSLPRGPEALRLSVISQGCIAPGTQDQEQAQVSQNSFPSVTLPVIFM